MNKRWLLQFLLLPFFINPARAQSPYIDLSDGILKPTLLRVLANPNEFHGKEIQIVAFLRLEFEGDALWLHQEDYSNAIIGNSIWVSATEEMYKNIKQINNKYVIIRGTFDANSHGHMGLHSGTLFKITRCQLWSDPKRPWVNRLPPPPPPPPAPKVKSSKEK